MNLPFKHYATTMTLFGALVGALGPANAANPHFVGKVTSTLNTESGTVQVCFKEAGLGSNQSISYVASANATATYVCRNAGGNCPNAANKRTVSGPVSSMGTFSSGQNGQITECLTINPPDPGTFACPPGQQLVVASISYSRLSITDTTTPVGPVAATPPAQSIGGSECPAP
jgi:hypothetical protein